MRRFQVGQGAEKHDILRSRHLDQTDGVTHPRLTGRRDTGTAKP